MDLVTLTTETVPTMTRTSPIAYTRSDATRHLPLHKRQFYHSRTGQPMTLDEVMSDQDSEDEVIDSAGQNPRVPRVADIVVRPNQDSEDEVIDSDSTDPKDKDEEVIDRFKQLWNSFVRTQRILADGHVPWACEAFSRFHEKELLENKSLYLCWRLFMMKLWRFDLVNGATINNCNTYLQNRYNGIETTIGFINCPSSSSSNNNRINRRPKVSKKNNNNSGNDEPAGQTGVRKSSRTRVRNR